MPNKGDLATAGLLFAIFALSFASVQPLPDVARMAPSIVGLLGMALALGVTVQLWVKQTAPEPAATESENGPPSRDLRSIAWVAVMATLVIAVGLIVGGTIAAALYLKIQANRRWTLSLGLPGSLALLLHLVLDAGLGLPLWAGLLFW